jgi:hypothetical protein
MVQQRQLDDKMDERLTPEVTGQNKVNDIYIGGPPPCDRMSDIIHYQNTNKYIRFSHQPSQCKLLHFFFPYSRFWLSLRRLRLCEFRVLTLHPLTN